MNRRKERKTDRQTGTKKIYDMQKAERKEKQRKFVTYKE